MESDEYEVYIQFICVFNLFATVHTLLSYCKILDLSMYVVRQNKSSEVNASELLENIENMFPCYSGVWIMYK